MAVNQDETRQERVQRMMDQHGDGLLRLCFMSLRDVRLAEDAVQETFLLVGLPILTVAGQGTDWASITQLREQVAVGWHQTYASQGKPIVVNIDITLPAVDCVPVLRVESSARVPLLDEQRAEYALAVPGAFGVSRNNPQWEGYGSSKPRNKLPKGWDFAWQSIDKPWDVDRAYAHDNPFTLRDALFFVKDYIKRAINPVISRFVACRLLVCRLFVA